MKLVTAVIAASALPLAGTSGAQQPETPDDQVGQGVPSTVHQEEALREVDGGLFEQLDEDGDGAISTQEAQAVPSLFESWSEYDQDEDQQLNSEELAAFEAQAVSPAETEDLEVARGEVTEEGLPTTEHQEQVTGDGRVEELDQDGDGAISREEAQGDASLLAEWDQLDEDGDERLDAAELSHLEE